MKRNYFVFAITLLGMYHTTCGQEVHTIFNLKNQMVTYDTLTTERANAQGLTLKLQQACDSLGLDIDSKALVSWKDNRFAFVEEPLEKFVLCLERWFNVAIDIEGAAVKDIKVNGTIEYETITDVLNLLQITAPINYTYDKDKQIFKIRSK